MLEGNPLKATKCGVACEFSKVKFYCLDCSALMCTNCNEEMHKDLNHNIILFSNDNIKWDDRDVIEDLFDDSLLASRVYEEVSRKLDCQNDSFSESEYPKESHVDWICKECTFSNKKASNMCEMCYFLRAEEDYRGEYNNKLQQYMDNIKPLFIKLEEYKEVPFENIVNEYMKTAVDNYEFSTWLKQMYLVDKDIAMVNEVVEKQGYRISMNELEQNYIELVNSKNRRFISTLPTALITPKLRSLKVLLQPEEINKKDSVANDMKDKIINEDEIWKIIEKDGQYSKCQVRMLMTELNLPEKDKVDFLRVLMDDSELGSYLRGSCPSGSVKIEHVRQALLDQILLDGAVNFLKQECQICYMEYPVPEMKTMMSCSHEFCKICFRKDVLANITEKNPCKWWCPSCTEESYKNIDKATHYFDLREFVNKEFNKDIIEVFEKKLLDEELMRRPLFHRCANDKCENGFEAEGQNMKVQCPACKMFMCLKCNREWKKEHEKITCQEFEIWILKNDPDLAKLLKDIGIECPGCGMRYALASGGCLHFDCSSCGLKFCGSCYEEFTSNCKRPNCMMSSGFHAHHPRNCFYYLRDNEPQELENMLQDTDYPKLVNKGDIQCPTIVTEEHTMVDDICGKSVHGSTGLCANHYKEYLVLFITRLNIDPADFTEISNLNIILSREYHIPLQQGSEENVALFLTRLRKEVKSKCSLYVPKGFNE